jgi:hypothetical protein
MKRYTRAWRWAALAFVGHTLFLIAVPVVDHYSFITLRNLQEQLVDRHAFELWWWTQNTYPHQLAELTFPFARITGRALLSDLLYYSWYLVVGSAPYVVSAAVLGRIRDHSRAHSHAIAAGSITGT